MTGRVAVPTPDSGVGLSFGPPVCDPGARRGTGAWVDPGPAYSHDPELVGEVLAHLAEVWPPTTPVTAWLLRWEMAERTNGMTIADQARDGQGWRLSHIHIVLSGKRVPIHPAVTRYVVAHEYGHAVETWLSARLGRDVLDEYAEIRAAKVRAASPGRWHQALEELFACDFRWLVARERGFWPHETRPPVDGVVIDWWSQQISAARDEDS